MQKHHLIHICDNLERRDGDEHFEYCKCGARFFLNRKPVGMSLGQIPVEWDYKHSIRQGKRLMETISNRKSVHHTS